MSDGSKLVKTMQKIAAPKSEDLTDIVSGVVVSIAPLVIKVTDDLILTEPFLILGAMVKKMEITINPHTHKIPPHSTESDSGHSHSIVGGSSSESLPTITLWRDLKLNDKVLMLRCYLGQTYYVMQREEGVV